MGRQTAFDLDMSEQVQAETPKESKDLNINWSSASRAEIPFSAKKGFADELYNSANMVVPPAFTAFNKKPPMIATNFNVHRPRPVARMTSSQSMPGLAPLF